MNISKMTSEQKKDLMTFNENLTFKMTVTPTGGQPQVAFVNKEVEILMYDNFPETKNAKYA